jgi:hypothetical protein
MYKKGSKRNQDQDRQAKKYGNRWGGQKEGKIYNNKAAHWSQHGSNVIDSFSEPKSNY